MYKNIVDFATDQLSILKYNYEGVESSVTWYDSDYTLEENFEYLSKMMISATGVLYMYYKAKESNKIEELYAGFKDDLSYADVPNGVKFSSNLKDVTVPFKTNKLFIHLNTDDRMLVNTILETLLANSLFAIDVVVEYVYNIVKEEDWSNATLQEFATKYFKEEVFDD